jgi:hypothetical protein
MPTTVVSEELAQLCYQLRTPSEVTATEKHVKAAVALIGLTTTLQEGTEPQILNIPLNAWMNDHFCVHTSAFTQVGKLLGDRCATDGAIVLNIGGGQIPILFRHVTILCIGSELIHFLEKISWMAQIQTSNRVATLLNIGTQ